MSDDEDRTLDLVRRFNEAFNQHDVEGVMQLMTDDVVFENTSGGRFEGQVAVRGLLTRAFELMAKGRFAAEGVFAAGDRCLVQWTYTFNSEKPDGGHVRGVDIFRLRQGLVAEKFSYVKSEEFVQQLGLQLPRT
jgi:ketosteroid isomerase-like protein